MSKFVLKKGIISLIFVIAAIAMEIVTFSLMGFGGVPTYFGFDLLFIFIVALVLAVIPFSVVSVILAIILLLVQGALSLMNITLYLLYGDIFSIDLLVFASDAKTAFSASVLRPASIIWLAAILLVAITGLIITLCKIKERFNFKRKYFLCLAAILAFGIIVTPISYNVHANNFYVDTVSEDVLKADDKNLYKNFSNKWAFFYKFGTYPFYFKNLIKRQTGSDGSEAVTLDDFNQYYSKPLNNSKNQYFGIDKGNNVIVIMLESMDEFLINEKYTPILYKLRNEGINFTNYHAQAKTDYSEASVILGSYPSPNKPNLVANWEEANGDWSVNQENPNASGNYFFSLPNILKSNGYNSANYFHPNNGAYYSRTYTHNSYGFDNLYFYNNNKMIADYPQSANYDYCGNWNLPERWFISEYLNEFIPDGKKFFSFFTTINAHGSYEDKNSSPYSNIFYAQIDDDDFSDIKNKSYYKYFKNALSEAMVVDDGIAYIFEQLEKRNLLQSTTVLFYADHYAYMNDLAYDMKDSAVTQSPTFKIPSFIYSPNLKNITIDKFMQAFDLTPTLMQLLGINYNTKYYLGEDAFSANQTVINSKIGGIFDDNFYSLDGIIKLYENPDATYKDFQSFQNNYVKLMEKWKYIDLLYEKDYLSLLIK